MMAWSQKAEGNLLTMGKSLRGAFIIRVELQRQRMLEETIERVLKRN